jgi:hypothetical protein
MKPAPFEHTPEFQHFTEAMRRLIAVPKVELDEQIKKHETETVKAQSRKASVRAVKTEG